MNQEKSIVVRNWRKVTLRANRSLRLIEKELVKNFIPRLEKPIFVVGVNNSGTTLLWKAMQNCYDLCAPPNSTQSLPNVPEQLRHPHNFKKAASRLFATPEFISHYYLNETDVNNSVILDINYFYSKYKVDGKRSIYKNGISTFKTRFLQAVFPDAYFVGIIRNGMAVIESIARMRSRRNLPPGKVIPSQFNYNLVERASQQWLFGNTIWLNDSKYLRNFTLIKYEDLVSRPERVLRDLGNFCEIDSEFNLNLSIPRGIGKNLNKSSFDTDRNEIQIERLDPATRNEIVKIIRPLMNEFGYSCDSAISKEFG